MDEFVGLLRSIGFSDNEAHLYLTLLRFGQRPISFLAQKAKINRGLAYSLLHELFEKGLATKHTKGRVLLFAPLEPEQLVAYLENKKREISSQQQKVEGVIGQLAALANPLSSKPKFRSFDGVDGARTLLSLVASGESKSIRAYLSLTETSSFVGSDYLDSFLNTLGRENQDIRAIQIGSAAKLRTTKTITLRAAPPNMAFPMSMFLYDDYLALLSSKEEGFALLIESREYIEMQEKLFDMLWLSLDQSTVRLGILHSLSGTMAISERAVVDGILMAVGEINDQGGILGKRIDPVVLDGASDPTQFAAQAEALITKHDVRAIFGGWTSASRKTMKPVVEKYGSLLWYSIQNEGLEESSNIIYAGALPNQQILPAVDWAMKNLGTKFYLVGSDYVFPKGAHEIAKERIKELGGEIVGESFLALGSTKCNPVVNDILQTKPQIILNTINGDTNISFFEELRFAGIRSQDVPTISFSLAEEEFSALPREQVLGDFAAWSYFQSIDTEKNKSFVERFQTKYGRHRRMTDPIQISYTGIHLYAAAAESAGSFETDAICEALRGMTHEAPEGTIRMDQESVHLHRFARIGQMTLDGNFKVVWSSPTPLKPEPYPAYRSKKEWESMLLSFQKSWGGAWEKN